MALMSSGLVVGSDFVLAPTSPYQQAGVCVDSKVASVLRAISFRNQDSDITRADDLNGKPAVLFTNVVGSMWNAYVFAIISYRSTPPPGSESPVAASTLLIAPADSSVLATNPMAGLASMSSA
jgi:hypothetical protein